jgi:predicted RNA binding protein YcfA (HicA-like mRNA interferase family)
LQIWLPIRYLCIMKAKEAIRLIEAEGWYEVRQKGSHRMFKHPTIPDLIVVPDHGAKDLKKGTERSILKTAGL